MVKYLFFKIFL